ncbi:MAG: 30S ribosomal protein S1 [Defluviitaleaceae bacterium]|nr:30S ribosomal protein S1 [Defluviitaleaceae bacterium]
MDEHNTFEELLAESFTTLHTGKVVKGTVLRVTPTEVIVDLGYKSDGVIPRSEFSEDTVTPLTELVKPGDEFDVFITRVNDGEGNVMASKKKLDSQAGYKLLEEALENKTPVPGKITEVIRGGLIANIHGCRAFVPSSQVAGRFIEDLTPFKGQELNFHILELDRSKRRIVAGRRELAALEVQQKRAELYEKIEVGTRMSGTVSRLVNFGAFIDLGGVDGLVHVSEISWKRVRKAEEVLKEGQTVNVIVIGIDQEKGKISLTMKDAAMNPWNGIEERFPVDHIVEGTVVRLAPFGAFVNLDDGVDGLIHISQIAHRHIVKPEDELTVGQNVSVVVTAVDVENNKISLSKKIADEELGYYTPEEPQYEEDEEVVEDDAKAEDEATAEEDTADKNQVDNDEAN